MAPEPEYAEGNSEYSKGRGGVPLLRPWDRRVSNEFLIMASGRRFFGDGWE